LSATSAAKVTPGDFEGSTPRAIDAFRADLERHGLSATVRLTRGREIAAACGQLAARGVEPAAGRTPASGAGDAPIA
jgi:23S rRNA (adenine2503-C2)-methyltransferase